MTLLLTLILCYLLGAIPFSFLVARRVRGIDLRRHGSGNLGATNVVRTLGPWWGALVLLLDIAKGALAVLAMTAVASTWPAGEPTPLHLPPDLWRIFAGSFAALGHTLSPFVGFHGGKGVATTGGAFFVLAPYPTLVCLAAFLAVFAATRIVSLASLSAAALLPLAVGFFELRSIEKNGFSKTIFFFSLGVALWVIFKHRGNIRRLQAGTEKTLDTNDGNGKEKP